MGVPQPLVAPKCCKDSPANGEPLCMHSGMKKWALEGSPERAPGWKTWSAELISELQAQARKVGLGPPRSPMQSSYPRGPRPHQGLGLELCLRGLLPSSFAEGPGQVSPLSPIKYPLCTPSSSLGRDSKASSCFSPTPSRANLLTGWVGGASLGYFSSFFSWVSGSLFPQVSPKSSLFLFFNLKKYFWGPGR